MLALLITTIFCFCNVLQLYLIPIFLDSSFLLPLEIEGYHIQSNAFSCKYPLAFNSLLDALLFCNTHDGSCKGVYDKICDGKNIFACIETSPLPASPDNGCSYIKIGKTCNIKAF